jgi:hypothetical protein
VELVKLLVTPKALRKKHTRTPEPDRVAQALELDDVRPK